MNRTDWLYGLKPGDTVNIRSTREFGIRAQAVVARGINVADEEPVIYAFIDGDLSKPVRFSSQGFLTGQDASHQMTDIFLMREGAGS